jgi:hypothetical protein
MQLILMAMAAYEGNEFIAFTCISVAITLNCSESFPPVCNANYNESNADIRAQSGWQGFFKQLTVSSRSVSAYVVTDSEVLHFVRRV